ncbi:type II toxin-antitoxin system PemK/MazF family toxin [Marinobacter sp.]|uniref:type II toxin-antitoxin system PemK/MazF family toxin n=1 Tax=Marinobacter sp. TaxID=50741 RepID=UPI0019C98C24|nr:type II toxin-antitoxin system PemK/MazF family toxin [Marinobacter sp.]MBC7193693.1 type II toxin-antitoxin system PemK/MazF family toxin [Marinobacter sp.]
MDLSQGEVVLCEFYFSDFRSAKKRPVLVFKDNLSFDDFVGIPISSKVQTLQSDELLLQPDSLREGTLPERSKVMIRKTFVISKSVVIKRYGILEAGHFRAVYESFCRYFECCQL